MQNAYSRACLALLSFLLSFSALGQGTATTPTPSLQYGKVELKDLDPALFAQDTGASAVVIVDFGRTYFSSNGQGGFSVVMERVRRVKILRESGFDQATLRIPLYRNNDKMESVQQLKATTYNVENGKLVKTSVKGGDAITTQINSHRSEKRLTLPGVKVGSVVEFTYQLTSDFIFTLPEWWFQEDVPVRWSEYRVQLPAFFDYTIALQGYAPLQITEQKYSTSLNFGFEGQPVKVANMRWVGQNVAAFQPEEFITTPADYKTHVQFQLRTINFPGEALRNVAATWRAMNDEMMLSAYFGGTLGSVGDLDKPLAKLKTSITDPQERAAAVVALVRENLAFNGTDEAFTSGSMRAALDRKQGNAAEVNLLLVSALRHAGLPALPVILSTRDHGALLDDEPVIDRFNFVLALTQFPDHPDALLDATEPYAAAGMLPERCLNTRGRVISDDATTQRWVTIRSAHRYGRFTSGSLTLDDKGSISGTLQQEFSGYSGQRFRRQAQQLDSDRLLSRYARLGSDMKLVRHAIKQPTDMSQPATLELEVANEAEGPAAPTVYFSMKDFGGLSENPLRQPQRQYPVDMGAATEQKVMLDLQIPAGYQLETVPPPLTLRTPDGAVRVMYSCTPAPDGKSVQIMSMLSFIRATYTAAEYDGLRTIYERLVSKHAEPVILKRKP